MRKVFFISTVVLILIASLLVGCSKETVDDSSNDVTTESGETAGQAMAKIPAVKGRTAPDPCPYRCTDKDGNRYCCQSPD